MYTSPLNPFSTVLALVFVLMVTSIKEAVEDIERARSDRDENKSKATVVTFDADGREVEHIIDRAKVSSISIYGINMRQSYL